jgi:hypothetical protein
MIFGLERFFLVTLLADRMRPYERQGQQPDGGPGDTVWRGGARDDARAWLPG